MQQTLFEMVYSWVDKLVSNRLKQAPFDKSYSGVISEILFDPDTPTNSSKFGTYKVKYGSSEKTFKLNDGLVHEIGERVDVHVYENNPNHILVEPIVQRVPPCKIVGDYSDNNEDKLTIYRKTKTNGKTYETEREYKFTVENKGTEDEKYTKLILPDGFEVEVDI